MPRAIPGRFRLLIIPGVTIILVVLFFGTLYLTLRSIQGFAGDQLWTESKSFKIGSLSGFSNGEYKLSAKYMSSQLTFSKDAILNLRHSGKASINNIPLEEGCNVLNIKIGDVLYINAKNVIIATGRRKC